MANGQIHITFDEAAIVTLQYFSELREYVESRIKEAEEGILLCTDVESLQTSKFAFEERKKAYEKVYFKIKELELKCRS